MANLLDTALLPNCIDTLYNKAMSAGMPDLARGCWQQNQLTNLHSRQPRQTVLLPCTAHQH
jgi:hypothetical protein